MATDKNVSSNLSSLESILESYLVDKAPFQLPANAKDLIVTLAPWLIIIFSFMSLPVILSLIGINNMTGSWMMRYGYGIGSTWWIATLLLAVAVVLQLLGIKGLFARTMQGWKYVFYAQLVSIVSSILYGNIIGALIGGLLGLYILFQVKELYS